MVVFEANNVVLIKISIRDFDDYPTALRGKTMNLLFSDPEHFSFAQRYGEFLLSLTDDRRRVALHEQPPLFAVVMVLEAQSLSGFDIDSF